MEDVRGLCRLEGLREGALLTRHGAPCMRLLRCQLVLLPRHADLTPKGRLPLPSTHILLVKDLVLNGTLLFSQMSNRVKTWFLAPSWDLPPDSVQLGSIIWDPKGPHIDKDHALFTPADTDRDILDHSVRATTKTDFEVRVEELKRLKVGLFARCLHSVPLGGEATAEKDKNAEENYKIQAMRTEWFAPSKALEKKATDAPDVADFLEQADYAVPVYMITGVRIAKGISVTTLRKRGRSLRGWFGIDLSSANVPLTVGAGGADEASSSEFAKFQQSSEIVFAYQLRELRVSDGKVVGQDFIDGALLGVGQDANERDTVIVSAQELEASHVDDGYEGVDEMDGSACICVPPNPVE